MEEWRPVVGWDGLYEASSAGRIRSLDRVNWCSHGASRVYKGQVLTGCIVYGYLVVSLRRPSKPAQSRKAHRIILEAFVGPCPPGMECRHLNGDRTDNRLENLSWGTPQENADDRIRHGNTRPGEESARSRLKESDIRDIRSGRRAGRTLEDLAAEYGVNHVTISAIARGKSWKHIPVPADESRVDTTSRGEARPLAKLRESDIPVIRAAVGRSNRDLAEEYGVSTTTIFHVRHRNTWKHV